MDKEKAKMMLIYCAMVAPGWNIACWAIGAGVYCLTDVHKEDAPECRFARLVLGAPATLPVMVYEKLSGKEII